MKKLHQGVLLVLSVFASLLQAKTFVWEVEKDGAKAFVAGSIHLLSEQDFPLPKEYHLAYQQSELLVFETDIEQASSSEFQKRLMQKALYTDGRRLKTVLNVEVYKKLEKAAADLGVPLSSLNQSRASFVGILLTVTALAKQGVTQDGIDKFFFNKAVADGKALGELETAGQQIELLTQLAEGKENEFITNTLRDLKNPNMFTKMKDYIMAGNHKGLVDDFLEPLKTTPDIYNALIVVRNNRWLPKIEAMLTTPERELIIVGALHLWGEEGVLTQLQGRGYKVVQFRQ